MEQEVAKKAECALCRDDTDNLHQCCPKQEDSLCASCWSQLLSFEAGKGRAGLILTGKFPCVQCGEPIERDRLPADVQTLLENIRSTIPTSKTPTSIEDFNYSYADGNLLRHRVTNEKFVFLSQRHYNALGSCLDAYIQTMLKNEPWNYEEIWLPEKTENVDDHHDQVNIFTSPDFRTNTNGCLVLLQGSGVVRPGQWARSCCINDSLDIGSMIPYMRRAQENGLSVIILNPNQTSYVCEAPTEDESATAAEEASATNPPAESEAVPPPQDEFVSYYLSSEPLPRPLTKKIPNLSTNREHVLYVYDNIISKCPAKQLYVVAHSAGGDGLMYLLRKRQDNILPTLAKIAFTDSVHSISPLESNEIKSFLRAKGIHFVASDEPMGTPQDSTYHFSRESACQEVSAGHPKHEYTSGCCVEGVFKFFFPPTHDIETTTF